jgi:hypothetical protein
MIHSQGRLPPLESTSKSEGPGAPVGAAEPLPGRGGIFILNPTPKGGSPLAIHSRPTRAKSAQTMNQTGKLFPA